MLKTNVVGICGNFDCDSSNDWEMSDGTSCIGNGTLLHSNGTDFAQHYQRDSCEFSSSQSFLLNPDPQVQATNQLGSSCNLVLLDMCDQVFDGAVFSECKTIIDPQQWIHNCKFDICNSVNATDQGI